MPSVNRPAIIETDAGGERGDIAFPSHDNGYQSPIPEEANDSGTRSGLVPPAKRPLPDPDTGKPAFPLERSGVAG